MRVRARKPYIVFPDTADAELGPSVVIPGMTGEAFGLVHEENRWWVAVTWDTAITHAGIPEREPIDVPFDILEIES